MFEQTDRYGRVGQIERSADSHVREKPMPAETLRIYEECKLADSAVRAPGS